MTAIIGTFRIGEDLAIALDAVEGGTAGVTAITASMQAARVAANKLEPDPDAPRTALSVSPQAAPAAGWTLSLGHAQTALLAPGIYGIDARIELGGAIEITDQTAFVSLTRAAIA